MSPVNVACWTELSLELWINVLSHLRANVGPRIVWNQRICLETFAEEHGEMHKLRLVCSKFNTALDDSQFSRCLFLREAFSTRSLPNLVRWTRHHHTSLQLFACNAGAPILEAALAAAACSGSQLQFAWITKVSQAAVDILPCYCALHSIDLATGGHSRPLLGLQPLAALPSLGKLILAEGTFQGVETLVHLTNLQVTDASVTCTAPCIWATNLLKLSVHDSELYLRGQGLAACQNLRSLTLRNCVVNASQHDDTLALMAHLAAKIPAGMAALTQLTTLIITFCGEALEDIDFSWLGSLTALQGLGFHAHDDVQLPAELTDLVSLINLWVTAVDTEDESVCIDFQVNWLKMCSLKTLSLNSGLYAFDSQLLQIVNCTTIKELSVDQVMPASADSAMYFAALMHNLAIKRPDVVCCWDRYMNPVNLSNILEEC